VDALVNINGVISPPEEAKISVFDRGFLFGDGVYETGRSYDRCFSFLEEHWARLRESARRLSIPFPWSDEELTFRLHETSRIFGADNAYFRSMVTRGTIASVGLDVEPTVPPTLVYILQSLTSKNDETRKVGVTLVTSTVIRNSALAQDPNIKSSNYLNSLLALREARARGAQDAVLCNSQGVVTEGTTFSVFGIRHASRSLITASLNVGILDSITRRHIIEVARPSYRVIESEFSLAEFLECDEVFIASSVREIIPVCRWDKKSFFIPAVETGKIHDLLRQLIRDYVATHAKY
jgi:branched-chain amino acid aminotransferase